MELTGQRALVTGATSGIGRAIARALAGAGATVHITGRRADLGAETVALIEDAGGTAHYIAADLGDLASIEQLADQAGHVDILVNNAGIFPLALTVDQDAAAFQDVFDVNVRAPYFLTAAVAPKMVAKGAGSIVNVSSMTSVIGVPTASVYSATKAALDSFTRTWASEFGGSGVRVNSVAPGPTRTEAVMATVGETYENQGADTLLARVAAPEEIAEVVLFLASPRSSYVTGAVVTADGGYTTV